MPPLPAFSRGIPCLAAGDRIAWRRRLARHQAADLPRRAAGAADQAAILNNPGGGDYAATPAGPAAAPGLGQTAGRARMSPPILRGKNWPSVKPPRNRPSSTTTLPRRIVMLGQAATSWPSHGV